MNPNNLKYSKTHEWVKIEESMAAIGVTDHAQSELGDIVYVELPKVGAKVQKDNPFGTLESVKTVSELVSPVSGEVVKVNGELPDAPEQVNEDPYGSGWMIVVKMDDPAEVDDLITAEEYGAFLQEL
jgi:glycine cleavage system H protein